MLRSSNWREKNLKKKNLKKKKHVGKVISTFTIVVGNPKGTRLLRRTGMEEGAVLKWL